MVVTQYTAQPEVLLTMPAHGKIVKMTQVNKEEDRKEQKL